MHIPTITELVAAMHAAGLGVPTNRHVVLLRRRDGKADAFDDMALIVDSNAAIVHAARCTTDPGKGPRMNPKNPQGCAVCAPGQVVDGLGWGRHHGEYECWVPVKPIPVDRYDSLGDTTPTRSTSMTTQIHRASATHESTVVGAYSEGCTVYANPADFAEALRLGKESGQARFTVSLLVWG